MLRVIFPVLMVIALVVGYSSSYIVDAREVAIQVCLGDITRVVNMAPKDSKKPGKNEKPGLYFMMPFICKKRAFSKLTMTLSGRSGRHGV